MRVSRADQKELNLRLDELRQAYLKVEEARRQLLIEWVAAANAYNETVENYNDAMNETKSFVESVGEGLRNDYDDKSERWQESDAGQAANDMIPEWEEFDPDPLERIEVVEPDELEESCEQKILDLPTES